VKVIVIGAGRVGSQVATALDLEGHDIVVVDKDPTVFNRLGKAFKGRTITGHGYDRDVLTDAGIERADALVAVTSGDNHNIVAALMAKNVFRVPKVVARIYDPERARIYAHLGIPTIASTAWSAERVKDMIVHGDLNHVMELGNGEVDLLEVSVPEGLVGKSVRDVTVPGEILVSALVRQGRGLIHGSGTVFERGDVMYVMVLSSAQSTFKRMLGLD